MAPPGEVDGEVRVLRGPDALRWSARRGPGPAVVMVVKALESLRFVAVWGRSSLAGS
jgi:hypothetical protein